MEHVIEFLRDNWVYVVLLFDSIAIFIQGFVLKKSNKVLPLNDVKSMIAYHKKMLSALEKVAAGMTDSSSTVDKKEGAENDIYNGTPSN